MEHTIDSLTDEQIDQLRNEAIDADDVETAAICSSALNPHCHFARKSEARRLIAAHLNAVASQIEVAP